MNFKEQKNALLHLYHYFKKEHGFNIFSMNYGPFQPIDYKILSEISEKIIEQGMKVEEEHTNNKFYQFLIAMHHIMEDKDYYKKLKTIHVD